MINHYLLSLTIIINNSMKRRSRDSQQELLNLCGEYKPEPLLVVINHYQPPKSID